MVTSERKKELAIQFGGSEANTGRTEVQIAIHTERIKQLTEHAKENPKDNNFRRGLLMLVGKRRRLLNYLIATDVDRYRNVIKDLGLRR
ncbi:MAG: 30S ribosomal protein S15 [Candidatus Fermentibacteria bacterium]|nr:30S ribosomal protein S15 [Candidatus Fermentibacteria bacterium]